MTDQRERDRFVFVLGYMASHGTKLGNIGISDPSGLADAFTRGFVQVRNEFPSITEAVLVDIVKNCSFQTIKPLLNEIIDRAKRA